MCSLEASPETIFSIECLFPGYNASRTASQVPLATDIVRTSQGLIFIDNGTCLKPNNCLAMCAERASYLRRWHGDCQVGVAARPSGYPSGHP